MRGDAARKNACATRSVPGFLCNIGGRFFMTELNVLWLPVLLSAVIVFVVSSVIHMLSPWHKSDYPQAPNEDKLRDAIRPLAIPPGDYMVPRASSREELK